MAHTGKVIGRLPSGGWLTATPRSRLAQLPDGTVEVSTVVRRVPQSGDIGAVDLTVGVEWVLRLSTGVSQRTYEPLRLEEGYSYDIGLLSWQEGSDPPAPPTPHQSGVVGVRVDGDRLVVREASGQEVSYLLPIPQIGPADIKRGRDYHFELRDEERTLVPHLTVPEAPGPSVSVVGKFEPGVKSGAGDHNPEGRVTLTSACGAGNVHLDLRLDPDVATEWPQKLVSFPGGGWHNRALSEITTPNGGAMYIGVSETGQAMEVWCHSMDKEGGRVIVNIPVFLGW